MCKCILLWSRRTKTSKNSNIVQLTPLQAPSVRFFTTWSSKFQNWPCEFGSLAIKETWIKTCHLYNKTIVCFRQISHYLCGVGIATMLLIPLLVYLDGFYLQHSVKNVWKPTLWVNVNWNSEVSNKSYQNKPLISIMLHEYQNLQHCTKTIFEVIFTI